jgi:glycosyltransferase involved in cell wall biosynthesis
MVPEYSNGHWRNRLQTGTGRGSIQVMNLRPEDAGNGIQLEKGKTLPPAASPGIGKPLRILVINWQDIHNPLAGGAEVHLHEIFRRIAARGHSVTLLCSRFPGAAAGEEIDGIKVVRRGSRNFFNFIVPFAYRRLRKEQRFDAVIDDLNKIPFYTPCYVREPLLTIIHHLFGRSIFLEAFFLPASYVWLAERLALRIYRKTPFAAVSESTRQELQQLGISAAIELLPNAVDHRRYSAAPEQKSAAPLICYLGRLKRYKSVEHAIRALPLVRHTIPDARMVVIGDGDNRAALEKLAAKLNLQDAVHFTGQVSREEKVHWLNRAWVAVNPSPKEGWGLTVIEANACAVPVVAADSPGLRDSVRDNETGRLYPYGDLPALADHLSALLGDRELRIKMGESALKWAGTFQWDYSADKALDIIQQLVLGSGAQQLAGS